MAKVKIKWKRVKAFVIEITEALDPLRPVKARVKFTGATAIDNEGGFQVGAKASADVQALVNGVPVSVEAGVHAEHDNQGASNLEIEIDYA